MSQSPVVEPVEACVSCSKVFEVSVITFSAPQRRGERAPLRAMIVRIRVRSEATIPWKERKKDSSVLT